MRSRAASPNRGRWAAGAGLWVVAAIVGAIVGIGSVGTTPEGRGKLAATAKEAGVASGMVRRRAPQAGDHWGGCNDARAAGTAPIYRGEPGYREDMDGDGDGEACEVRWGR